MGKHRLGHDLVRDLLVHLEGEPAYLSSGTDSYNGDIPRPRPTVTPHRVEFQRGSGSGAGIRCARGLGAWCAGTRDRSTASIRAIHPGEDESMQGVCVCVCKGGDLRAAFRDDLDRYVFVVQKQYGITGRLMPLRVGLLSQGLWATTAYRLNHYARHRLRSQLLGVPPSVFHHDASNLGHLSEMCHFDNLAPAYLPVNKPSPACSDACRVSTGQKGWGWCARWHLGGACGGALKGALVTSAGLA
jgi:hypothetical protein